MTPAGVRSWLGEPRFARYTAAAGGDEDLALGLYQWNAQAAAAALVDVGHFEVALRNAYDRQLGHRFPGWAVDQASPVFHQVQGRGPTRDEQTRMNDRSRQELERARRGLGGHPTHGQVVGALSFGFWAQMTHRQRTATFWAPTIRLSFPPETHVVRGRIHELVQNVVKFRNRLAHNEPVFSTRTGLDQRRDDVTTLFWMVHPTAAASTEAHSTVTAVLSRCPVPNLMPPAAQKAPLTGAQLAALNSPTVSRPDSPR